MNALSNVLTTSATRTVVEINAPLVKDAPSTGSGETSEGDGDDQKEGHSKASSLDLLGLFKAEAAVNGKLKLRLGAVQTGQDRHILIPSTSQTSSAPITVSFQVFLQTIYLNAPVR